MYRKFAATMSGRENSEIRFYVNGSEHKVSQKYSASTSLNDYLREVAGLKGTKVMCREAGCGCCSVSVTRLSPESDKLETYSVQSCLTPLYAVDGWQISTIEGIGNQKNGFHPVQERIASFNGTQCGYCTPGMVMNMYGLLHQKPNITTQDVEDNFDGNICRCTGYRSILDAMKSFAADSNIPGAKAIDIEDLNKNLCPRTGEPCTGDHGQGGTRSLNIQINGTSWYRPTSLDDLGNLLRSNKDKKVKMLFGNTAAGIFKNEGPFEVYIDLHNVKEIFSFTAGAGSFKFGAATSLTTFMDKLKANQEKPGFKYFSAVHKHLKFVANVMVRNAGSIAGNLMIKRAHPEFPSDIFTMLESLGAKVDIYDAKTSTTNKYSLLDFLKKVNMSQKVLVAVELPSLDGDVFRSFKITPRWQNAHAYVNAAFRIKANNRTIAAKPSFVFGGINAQTVHAEKTEAFLTQKTLSPTVVKEALTILKNELKPEYDQVLASPKYRQDLSVALLYKVLLGIYKPDNLKLRSGADNLNRPISSGLQTYQEITSELPLKQALAKKTAPLQASGEAQFVNDIPTFQHELFGAYALSDEASATIKSIDASEALKMPGVVSFLTAKDIPEGGTNNYLLNAPSFAFMQFQAQEIFASKEIFFCGQPVGLILAETQSQAIAASKKVKVEYSEVRKPIMTIEESIAQGKEYEFMKEFVSGQPDEAWKSVDKVVGGEARMGRQYHYFLETQVSLAVPSEDGIDLYAATQATDLNQHAAAAAIGKSMNYINITVPRLGGGFGGKAWDSCSMSAAATLGAYLTGRPVRIAIDMSTNMQMCGKRAALLAKYKAGFSSTGDVQVLELELYLDGGCSESNKSELGHIMHYLDLGYHIPHWKIKPHVMFTNKQTNSPVRAPGAVPAAVVTETIMEHVAKALNKHPIPVKELNLYEKDQPDPSGHEQVHCTIRELWRRLKDTAEVDGRMRQVDAFNQENLWKKRGITMTTNKYGMIFMGPGHTANVSIYSRDGTVAVSQGGVEMGQGLYTKVAQGVASVLGIPLELIKVRSNQGIITPNNVLTGGSVSSELATQAAMDAANILKERMRPIKEKFPDDDWKEVCAKCSMNKIDLSAKATNTGPPGSPLFTYFTYCVAAVETEVDILTGESQIRRVDIMADFGESLNPMIDIGQVEGAFVMGLGCYLSEDVIYDGKTGKVLNDGTWEYKPPTTKDIPIDWRIHLLPDSSNPVGIRSSKAVGEPPISLAMGAALANKLAIESARKDIFGADNFIPGVTPFTVEKAQQSAGLTIDNLVL